jgi:outer membrane receptor protein involved in Fe transport
MVLTAVPRLQAQTAHTAPQAALDAALQQHAAAGASDREAVLRVLGHPEVKAVAERAGVDLRRASSAVATLGGEQLAQVAAQAQQVEQALAGGQSRVVISTTLIIIALLVLILIIVAVD